MKLRVNTTSDGDRSVSVHVEEVGQWYFGLVEEFDICASDVWCDA